MLGTTAIPLARSTHTVLVVRLLEREEKKGTTADPSAECRVPSGIGSNLMKSTPDLGIPSASRPHLPSRSTERVYLGTSSMIPAIRSTLF